MIFQMSEKGGNAEYDQCYWSKYLISKNHCIDSLVFLEIIPLSKLLKILLFSILISNLWSANCTTITKNLRHSPFLANVNGNRQHSTTPQRIKISQGTCLSI